jgi:hypothetical protein
MAIITSRFDTTTNKDLLKTGSLRSIFDTTVREAEVFYPKMVNNLTTKDEYERVQRMAGLDLPVEIADGQQIPITTPVLGTSKTYTQRQFGSGFRMTYRMDKFNKYNLWKRWAKDLAKLAKESKDIEIHVMFNNMTSTALTCGVGFDTMAIGNNAHTGLLSGSTSDNYDNYLGSALSMSALESARYYFATLKDDKGLYMGARPDTLFYESTLWPTVKELLGSDLRPHEMSNTTNWASSWGIKPFENPRLTSTTCWGVLAKGDSNYDFNVFTTQEPTMYVLEKFDRTLDKACLNIQFFTYGFGDARMCYVGNI